MLHFSNLSNALYLPRHIKTSQEGVESTPRMLAALRRFFLRHKMRVLCFVPSQVTPVKPSGSPRFGLQPVALMGTCVFLAISSVNQFSWPTAVEMLLTWLFRGSCWDKTEAICSPVKGFLLFLCLQTLCFYVEHVPKYSSCFWSHYICARRLARLALLTYCTWGKVVS